MISNSGKQYRVKAGGGLEIAEAKIEAELSKFDKDHFIALAVWSDSFENVYRFRASCNKLNIEHRIFPIPDGKPVDESPSAGGAKAQ